MIYEKLSFPVKSFDGWKPGFVNHADVRKAHSCVGTKVYTEPGNKNKIIVVMVWSDKGEMEKFGSSSELKEAMQKAGVTGPPQVSFQETEFDVSSLELQFETDG